MPLPHVPQVYLLINATRANQSGIESLRVVGRHDHDSPWSVHNSIEDVQEALQHEYQGKPERKKKERATEKAKAKAKNVT